MDVKCCGVIDIHSRISISSRKMTDKLDFVRSLSKFFVDCPCLFINPAILEMDRPYQQIGSLVIKIAAASKQPGNKLDSQVIWHTIGIPEDNCSAQV
jgi:hypothetical protein